MIKKIKRLMLITLASLSLLSPGLLIPVLNGVASADITQDVCNGSQSASGSGGGSTSCASSAVNSSSLTNLARTITKWFSIIVGAISILMIIYGGFRYITSGGDSGRVGTAKNTLIYAIVGLIIVALAQVIVNFVLTQASNSTTNFNNPNG
jgi:Type IV secretion system pilin